MRRSRISSRCLRCVVTAARFSSASIASLRRSGLRERSAGARICCSSAASRSARGAEDAQVAPADAVAGQLGDRARRSRARSRRSTCVPRAHLALDDAVLLELGDEPRLGARSPRRRPRASTARRVRGAVTLGRRCAAPRASPAAAPARARRRRAPRGPEASSWRITRSGRNSSRCRRRIVRRRCDVAGGVEPVAAGRAPRRQQLLVLEVADLRDRDVRELLLERLADGADRHRLARRAGVGVGLDLGGDRFPVRPGRPSASLREEGELVLADLQLVAVLQPVRLDALAVDVGAVERAEVVEVVVAAAAGRAARGRARR